MLKIAWKRFISSANIYVFVIVQLSIVLSICLIMVSTVCSRFEYYVPLKRLMDQNASAVQLESETHGSSNGKTMTMIAFRDIDPLSKTFPDKAHTWYVRYNPLIVPMDNNTQQHVFISYTENTWLLYEPKMSEGNWNGVLSSGLTENGNIPVIVYQHHTDYKIGDTFQVKKVVTYDTDSENPDTICLEISGILDNEAMLFGGNISDGLHNHTSFYIPADELIFSEKKDAEGAVFVMSQDLIDRIGVASSISPCNGIISYDNHLSQEQVIMNTEQFRSMTGLPAENITSIKDFSLLYITQQVYTLLPVFVCITILSLISSICTSAVITKKNLHSYAIFHLCGATSGKCVFICIIQTIFVSIIALLSAGCFITIISIVKNIPVIYNSTSLLICAGFLVLHLFLTSMLPAHMLKANSLKNLL